MYLEAFEREPPCRQAVRLGRGVSGLGVGHGDTETLHPLLRVLPILGLEDEGLVSREDLEGLGDVAGTPGYFHRPYLVYVDAFTPTLQRCVLIYLLASSNLLIWIHLENLVKKTPR